MGKRSRAMACVKTTRNGDKQFDEIRKNKVFVLVNTIGCIIQYNEEPKSENKFSFFNKYSMCVMLIHLPCIMKTQVLKRPL